MDPSSQPSGLVQPAFRNPHSATRNLKMPIIAFPDPRTANSEGIVGVGGDLHPQSLLLAYRQGIFPWPVEGLPMLWFCPARRAILDFSDLHVPRSLARTRRSTRLRFSLDEEFGGVIRACSQTPRPGQDGTWITRDVIHAYARLHRIGIAHSAEAWNGPRLVGGIYGVEIDGAFAAESMFYHEANASKLTLLFLIGHLQSRGLEWMDIQVMTPHLRRLGAKEIVRNEFLAKLQVTRARGLRLFAQRTRRAGEDVAPSSIVPRKAGEGLERFPSSAKRGRVREGAVEKWRTP